MLQGDAEKDPPCRGVDVDQQAFMQQEFDKFGRNLMRRRDQGRIDEAAPAHGVPERDRAGPWRKSR